MTKNSLKQISLFLFLAIFLIGLTFFQKEKEEEFKTEDNKTEQLAILEQKKAENIISNFAVVYHSYNVGDFSNIESLYSLMTEKMKKSEQAKIEKMKAEALNQIPKYQTATAEFRGLSTKEFANNQIITNIIIFKQNFNGSYIPNPENQEQLVLVDQSGQPYTGDISELLSSKDLKALQITSLKENGEWKIDGVTEPATETISETENLEIIDEEDTVILE